MDGGEVWKQTKSKRLRFDECNFLVTIEDDLFGHAMVIDGETTKIRVKRLR